jgi:hypothetical protein
VNDHQKKRLLDELPFFDPVKRIGVGIGEEVIYRIHPQGLGQ